MRIDELFNTAYQWKWDSIEDDYYAAAFNTDKNHHYLVEFHYEPEDMHAWDISFYILDRRVSIDRYGLSKTGDSAKVLSTILNILTHFIKQEQPSLITFSAGEPSRQSLYSRLVDKLFNAPGMRVEKRMIKSILYFRIFL